MHTCSQCTQYFYSSSIFNNNFIYITVREFLFLYCNESVLFFLILNIQIGGFKFVKKFDTVRIIIITEKNTIKYSDIMEATVRVTKKKCLTLETKQCVTRRFTKIWCLGNDGRFQVIIFGIKTFDHTNDSLFKRVTKHTKLNTPEQQLWHSHHTIHIRQAYQNILKK
jgi:hypothetical protein